MGNIGVSMPSGHMDACQYRDFGCFCHNREFLRICAIVRATYEHVAIGDFVLFTIVKSILELMPVYGVYFFCFLPLLEVYWDLCRCSKVFPI